MRGYIVILALGVLAACTAPPIPDSGPKAGTPEAQRAREAALANPGLPSPYAISDENSGVVGANATFATAPSSPNSDTDIAAQTTAALAATAADSGVPPVAASASPPHPTPPNPAGISSENDFDVVSAEQTIESDAARIASNRSNYEVIAPAALPTRPSGTQPNIVAYALQSNNPRGVKVYNRSGLNTQARSVKNCAKFASPDQAQTQFLKNGGPQKDRKSLDPDGDGYACSWDPAPFRTAVSN